MDDERFLERYNALKPYIYLPLFYLIPDEIARTRKLDKFPRDPMVVASDDYWRKIYFGKHFLVTVADTWAWMMWQHLGIRGGFDSYSKNDPFVNMCVNLSMWAWLLSEIRIDISLLASFPDGEEIAFLNMENAALNCDKFAMLFWEHPTLHMSKVRDVVAEHRAHADYSNRNSHIKYDFYRSYYHTRSKTKVLDIDAEDKDTVTEINRFAYRANAFADLECRLWLDDFLKNLDERDRKIIKLLIEGYTQEEIAAIIGYANHSGICKRLKHIRSKLMEYQSK